MAENPYNQTFLRGALNETDFRTNLESTANMAGGLKDIAARTGADQINSNDVPSIGALANMKYGQDVESRARETASGRLTKGLPAYASGYRQYLKWRYPSRYGGASSTSYTTDFTQSGADIADLGDPFAPPGFGK